MLIAQARAFVRQFARNAGDSSSYSDSDIDRAVQTIGNDFIRHTNATRTTSTAAITAASSAVTFAAITNFRADRLLRVWIDTYTLQMVDLATILDTQRENASLARPSAIGFDSSNTAQLWPTPDVNYTLNAMWVPPFTVWTAGTLYAASATATVAGGLVTALTLGNPGGRYATAPTISFSGGGGSNAAATCTVDAAGQVNSFAITNAGTGYTTAPTVAFSGSSIADVALNLPDDVLQEVLIYGATSLLQHTEIEHQYSSESWKKYQEFVASYRDSGNLGARVVYSQPSTSRTPRRRILNWWQG